MALLGQARSGEATFTETRRVEMLDRTLMSSGRLSFRAPDKFIRETLKPHHEKLAVDGNTMTMTVGERSRTMQLDASPEASVLVEAVRGTLTGNRADARAPVRGDGLGHARALDARARAARPASARPGPVGATLRARGDGARGPGPARRRRPLGDDDRARHRPQRPEPMAAPFPIGRRAALTLALWVGALGAGLAIAWRAHYVADLSAFLPGRADRRAGGAARSAEKRSRPHAWS